VEAGSNTSTVTLRVVGGDEKGSLESETVKCGHKSHWTRQGPAAIEQTPILSSERMLHKEYDRKCSVEKIAGCESQGAWGQDELIGGKPPVVR
jgi:hypothetical protein